MFGEKYVSIIIRATASAFAMTASLDKIRIYSGASETIAADLVVHASGRGGPTLALLQSIGRPPPEETTIGIDLGYATCIFAIPDDASAGWKGLMTFGQVP